MGKEAFPLVQEYVEGVTFFDEEVQRHLDVLDAVVRAWANQEIEVRSETYAGRS